jgi:hypothetical protein
LAAAVTIAVAVAVVNAQKTTEVHPGKGGSPHVRTEWTIDGANISIEYGRPALTSPKDGKVRGDSEVMPPGQVWRTGADEATTLKTDKMLMFGGTHLSPGTYTLWTLPGEKEWLLIFNKQTGQWGTTYDAKQDLAREKMTIQKTAKPVERLTISIDDTPKGATLRIEWGTASASIPFMVM